MRDKRMKALGLFTALSLAVCLVASGIVFDVGSSYATMISLKWMRITIPVTDEMQLYPGSDVGPMAVTPDGATVFAAVQNESTGSWDLLKSIDGAFSWQNTGLSDAMAAQTPDDTLAIVAVELSPSWNDDGRIFVATKNRVYSSKDRGLIFEGLAAVPGTKYAGGAAPPPPYHEITSLALGTDSSGGVVVAVGTWDNPFPPVAPLGGEVYILDEGTWSTGTPPHPIGAAVLAVGLSPNYATDQAVIAVVTDGIKTMVRTKRLAGGWGATISNATIKDQDVNDFWLNRACIGLPDDYNATSQTGSVLTCFVGLWGARGPLGAPLWEPLGDVFRINGGWMSPSTFTDLNVRGTVGADPSETNIWSMAVSGSASNMTIIAGTVGLNLSSPQFLVYTSSDSGGNWSPNYQNNAYISYKQPTGEEWATVVMTSSVAYVGTFGDQSAVSAAVASTAAGGGFSSWNQRGLIDTSIDEITDMSPSEAYYADGKMFITTKNTSVGDTSLWRTETEGNTWERVYCSTLTASADTLTPTCVFNTVKTASGGAVVLAQIGGTGVIPSTDDGATFRFDPWNPTIGNVPAYITAFAVADVSTYYAGDANGVVRKWTDDSGGWTPSTESDIPSTDTVKDLVLTDGGDIYVGTDQGGVYKDSGGDLAFVQVGPSKPGVSGDIVHVASNPCDDNFVYAGIKGSAKGIWRFDLSDEEAAEWEQIAGTEVGDISSIACSDCIGMDGVLYAVSESQGIGWRSINPASTKEETVFEKMESGLTISAGDSVRRGLKLVSAPNILFAVGGASYTQIWIASDETVKMKLLAPEDGSIAGDIMQDEAFLGRARVMLEWKDILRAESYEVQIGFDEELNSPVDISYYDGGTRYSNGTVKVVYPWFGTKYYWRVRVGKAGPGGTVGAPYSSQWSETWSFITPLGPALAMPELLGPKAGKENVGLKPLLQWNSSVAATGYELMLAANCDWNNPVLNLSGESAISGDTAYQITFDLAKNTSYCWQVRGVNKITHSPWSDTGTFTTGFTSGAETVGLPVWIWVIIVLATVFMLSILVLVSQSRRY